MKCLILAAGRGNRLSSEGVSKPLVELVGMPLIERTILTAQGAGVCDFFVVTGYEGEKVRKFLSDLGRRRNLKITTIQNDEWENTNNGVSVLKAKEYLDENFILLMADHVFEEATLVNLMKQPAADNEILLAADFNVMENKLVDTKDVTKVRVKDDSILDIGKHLERYEAYDTGMFLCSPAIFPAIEESSRGGDTSLSGAVKVFASQGKAKVFNIEGRFWIDVDTPADRKKAQKLLYSTLTKPHDGWIARQINRKFSIRIFTPLILKLRPEISPNQVSLISAAVGVVAGACFFFHLALIGGILIQLASILDGCDGEIARLKKKQSPFGKFLDSVLDRYIDSTILFGMFYYSLTSTELANLFGAIRTPLVLVASMLALLGNFMVSYTSAKSITDLGHQYRGRWIAAGRGRDLRLFLLFLGGVLAWVHPISVFLTILIVAVLANAIVLKRMAVSHTYAQSRNPLLDHAPKAVIFDFDGTIADTMPFLTDLAVKLIVENYEISKETAFRMYRDTTGMDFASQMEEIFPGHSKNPEVIDAFETSKREGVLDHALFPEVLPTLQFLKKRNIKRFICTSTKSEILREYVTRYKITDYVDACLGYKKGFEKDKQIESIMERYGLEPEEVIFVGDSLRDGDFVKDRKVRFIGIRRIFDEEAFARHGLFNVEDLTAMTLLWEQSENLLQFVEKVK